MKILKILTLGFMISLLFINMNCEDPPDPDPKPELPPITHEGKNTFGCLVNGEVWVPDVSDGWMENTITTGIDDTSFKIKARIIKNPRDERLTIFIVHGFAGVGVYNLNVRKPGFAYLSDYENNLCFETDTICNGSIEITYFDLQKDIISGIFSFKAVSQYYDTINVTEGRFDIKF